MQLPSYTNCNLGGIPVAFRLGRPVATALDGWLQLRLYTSSNSACQPIASSVVHKLQLISSTNCNFRRTQIATLVVGQLHSGWVGQLQLPWMAGCSFVCIPVPTQPVSRLHLQSYTNCDSGARPVATHVIGQLHSVQRVYRPSLTLRSTSQRTPAGDSPHFPAKPTLVHAKLNGHNQPCEATS